MDTTLDVFNGSAFTFVSLTDYINKMPFVPGRVGKLGIFEPQPIATTDVSVEEYQGSLSLIPTTPRGAPGTQNQHNKRVVRKLSVPHLQLDDTVMADEVQNVRVFGSTDIAQGPMMVLDQRFVEMNQKHDATVEWGRMGALRGIIYDADGATVIYNLFNEFNVTQQTQDYAWGTTGTNPLLSGMAVKGKIELELGAGTYQSVHALCGATFFSKLISNAVVYAAYQFQQEQQSAVLREDLRYDGFTYGGITYEQYRGNVSGQPYVPDTEGIAFPVGSPNLFKTYFAPGDWMETVNTLGLPRYAKQYPDTKGKSITLETQSNPLSICKRPRVLIRLFSSN